MIKEYQKRILSSFFLFPISFFFIIKGSFFFNFFLIIFFLISSYEWYMMSNKKNYHLFGYLFLFASFISAYLLRNLETQISGLFIFLFVTIICISSDIGGYIFGKIFKGPKLTKISPKKTYSGIIGGYFLSLISIYFFIIFYQKYDYQNILYSIKLILIVLIITLTSQIGDILISYFKRLSNVKDTGKIIPGHGGLLDRIDGMIFAFPVAYILFFINTYLI